MACLHIALLCPPLQVSSAKFFCEASFLIFSVLLWQHQWLCNTNVSAYCEQEKVQLVNTAPPPLPKVGPKLSLHKFSLLAIEMPFELPFCGCSMIIR